ncbi:MAG: 30S ribosome-binding factor RbfA [Methylococcaceae bacterium]|nr:30S ribosome-binding factor RbfA [Methylococcaceae bacterium]MCI0733990.1 30S ribosome-binding factor RbfA [Methylococcaceae bacterium]
MPREFSRSQRVASQMQRELAIILQSEIKDPRLGFITVNEVELSRDLSVAKVYFTVLGKAHDQVEQDREIFARSIPFIRRELGKRMRIRVLPELRFIHDESIDQGMRIDRLLRERTPEADESREDSE